MAKITVKLNPDVPPTGSDLGFVNAARRSFNSRSWWDSCSANTEYEGVVTQWVDVGNLDPVPMYLKEKDKRLLEFLARGMTAKDFEAFVHQVPAPDTEEHTKELKEKLWQWRNTPTHDTPFNHGFISFEVKAPIFVRAQLVKHEYLILSEFSRRYITDGIEFLEPDYWRKASEDKKQGSLEEAVSSKLYLQDQVNVLQQTVIENYKRMIRQGVAPEQARMVLPQSTMTEWTWSGTPGAFFKMCQLRLASDAQYETRLVAQEVYNELCKAYPVSAPLMVKGVF